MSIYPPSPCDISFWLPVQAAGGEAFSSNDFFDLVRDVCGDLAEQVSLVDQFVNKKTGRTSHCYRVVYRSMERTLVMTEVTALHKELAQKATERLGVEIR